MNRFQFPVIENKEKTVSIETESITDVTLPYGQNGLSLKPFGLWVTEGYSNTK